VVNDDNAGISLAVSHLVALGHTRIAHLAGPQDLSTGRERREGFARAMKREGLQHDDSLVAIADSFSEVEGQRALGSLIDGAVRFTAVVAGNDLLALGCYDALSARGLRCPADVSVTGFNDMPFVDKLAPPLTTVRIQHYEMGVRAATALLTEIRDPAAAKADIKLEPTLVVRGSTAAPKLAGRKSAVGE
jgi:LacI family transcriptional regulator